MLSKNLLKEGGDNDNLDGLDEDDTDLDRRWLKEHGYQGPILDEIEEEAAGKSKFLGKEDGS